MVAAHPDDETVAAGARLRHLSDVWVLHVTDGAPADPSLWTSPAPSREAYRETRRAEAERALGLAGVPAGRIRCLGLPDQEVLHHLDPAIETLRQEFERIRPEIVITHAYEGGHPDHDATAFAVFAALAHLSQVPEPARAEMTSYHLGPSGLTAGRFLPAGGRGSRCEPIVMDLDADEQAQKREMLDAFHSQKELLDRMWCDTESFRLAPEYDFTRPPHEGPLFYETLGWKTTSADLCATVAQAAQRAGV
jgi:LmbE family N-acetylglucosaminyl deacetylase